MGAANFPNITVYPFINDRVNRYARIICEYVMGTVVGLGNACSLPAPPRGSAQKHFHTDAPTGRRCESAFILLSHRESNKEVALIGPVW